MGRPTGDWPVKFRLDDSALAAFERDGFITVKQLVPADEVARMRDIILRLHDENVGFEEGAQYDALAPDGDTKQRRFPQITNPRFYADELTATEFYKVGAEIARQLLGDKVRFKADLSFLKPARIGAPTAWHQDEAFGDPKIEYKEISIWLALTPANASNSCMSFIPGSHLTPLLDHRPVGGDPRSHALECQDGFDPSLAIECPLSPGDCTIHAHRTLHYAGPNPSDSARLGYVLMYDTPPRPRTIPREFRWQTQQSTDRSSREQSWRRRGGIFVHVWRYRHAMVANRAAVLRARIESIFGWARHPR
jgi:ectoine hydroxylase-related dioxygenase (phytanoyl-CoA dioxygenase family)